MSGLFYSECSVPLFMMDNQNVVRRCGRLSGFISAIFFTIFFIIGTVFVTLHHNRKEVDPLTGEEIEKKFVWWPIVVGVSCIIFVWLFFPFMSGYVSVLRFRRSKIEEKLMKKRGLSKKEIYKQQQKLYEKRIETDARIKAARIQADAYRDRY